MSGSQLVLKARPVARFVGGASMSRTFYHATERKGEAVRRVQDE
jgi:hypothetical protein